MCLSLYFGWLYNRLWFRNHTAFKQTLWQRAVTTSKKVKSTTYKKFWKKITNNYTRIGKPFSPSRPDNVGNEKWRTARYCKQRSGQACQGLLSWIVAFMRKSTILHLQHSFWNIFLQHGTTRTWNCLMSLSLYTTMIWILSTRALLFKSISLKQFLPASQV